MNQERWTRFKKVVTEAMKADSPASRTALLLRECGDDPTLRYEAESFFSDIETTDGGGEDPFEEWVTVAAAATHEGEPVMAGRRLGAYVIVQELGRGGMATVYLAVRADGYFEKKVAIKVLQPTRGGHTAELLRRFRAEREVLASLEHPNIATILDAGTTEDGLPYFVMEYVRGLPVVDYIRDHNLPFPDRLTLFLKICAAVEVAHRKRIVHRDLKRNNILVNEEGEPKLLDFGIAKLLEEDQASHTATGQQRLTPISASPEQACGEPVTMASDIYALGVLLYEILTGRNPHLFSSSSPDLDEVARIVCSTEPIAPSLAVTDPEMQRALKGDLDAIVLRAIEKHPKQRYASIGDLTRDIRHHMTGEPVQVRPHKLSEVTTGWWERHKLLTAASIIVIVLAGSLILW